MEESSMKFLVHTKKPVDVLAGVFELSMTILTSAGPLVIMAGNYLVIDSDGKLLSVTSEEFLENYSAKDDPDLLTDIQINILERLKFI
jgi:hypothetical protein